MSMHLTKFNNIQSVDKSSHTGFWISLRLPSLRHVVDAFNIFFGKFSAGVKMFGRFTNEQYFSSFQNAPTFPLQRKIFRQTLLITLTPSEK